MVFRHLFYPKAENLHFLGVKLGFREVKTINRIRHEILRKNVGLTHVLVQSRKISFLGHLAQLRPVRTRRQFLVFGH